MAGTYVTILEAEFDNIFKTEKGWTKELSGQAQEIVYTKNLKSKPNLQVRVYSTIHKDSGLSRTVGSDSIKVCVINIVLNRGVIKTKRIHRTSGWDQRVTDRVIDVWNQLLQ